MSDQPADRSTGSADEPAGLLDAAMAWLAVDPDPDTRAELSELVAAAGAGDAAPLASASPGGCSSAPPGCGASSAPGRCA